MKRPDVRSAWGMTIRTTRQLSDEGLDAAQIRRLLRTGALTRVRRGVYERDVLDLEPEARHRRLIGATVPLLRSDVVLSHVSAGVLHELPVPRGGLDRVWITRPTAGGGHRTGTLHEHKAALDPRDILEIDGRQVTSLPRTVVDLSRRVGWDYGLAAADQALRRGVPLADLEDQVRRWPGRPGIARARRVVALADGRSESFGESASRLVIWQLGLPAPIPQFEVLAAGRRYRSDFGWPSFGVLGEFDGRVKYGDLLPPGTSAADVLLAEKRREQHLQAAGWYVARWGMAEVRDPAALDALLRSAFRNAGRRAAVG